MSIVISICLKPEKEFQAGANICTIVSYCKFNKPKVRKYLQHNNFFKHSKLLPRIYSLYTLSTTSQAGSKGSIFRFELRGRTH